MFHIFLFFKSRFVFVLIQHQGANWLLRETPGSCMKEKRSINCALAVLGVLGVLPLSSALTTQNSCLASCVVLF